MSMDLIIKNATVIDGNNTPGFIADVGIKDNSICKIGQLADLRDIKVIEAQGRVLCPGFVDIHSHSDYHLLINPPAESKIRQGVTTEVGGNCGYSAAPIGGQVLIERQCQYKENFNLELDWQSLAQYRQRLEDTKISVNYVPLIGHNTVRASVMGLQDRPPTQQELSQMEELVAQAMQEGAFGISSGLVYPPACYAQPPELVALCKVVARYRGFLTCHIRSEGPQLLESLEEIIGIAEAAQIPLQISHLKTAGSQNWYKLDQAFALIETAQARGLEVTADRYPYLASNAGLQVLLPDWAFEGSLSKQLERLQDKAIRQQLTDAILKNHPDEEYWDKVFISQVASKENQHWAGLTVADGAGLQDKSPLDFVFDLLLEEKMQVDAIYFIMNEKNLHRILAKPYVMVGSDAACRAHYGPLSQGKPHPRSFGTFPRILSHFVNKESVLTMKEAIHKMTVAPCKKLGLRNRGQIKEGFAADLVIFTPETVADTATYQNPINYPTGIEHVIVNGVVTVENGEHIGKGAGKVLSHYG